MDRIDKGLGLVAVGIFLMACTAQSTTAENVRYPHDSRESRSASVAHSAHVCMGTGCGPVALLEEWTLGDAQASQDFQRSELPGACYSTSCGPLKDGSVWTLDYRVTAHECMATVCGSTAPMPTAAEPRAAFVRHPRQSLANWRPVIGATVTTTTDAPTRTVK